MASTSLKPTLDAIAILIKRYTNRVFSRLPVDVSGRSRYAWLMLQSFAKFIIGTAHVLSESVSACFFVLGKVVIGKAASPRRGLFRGVARVR